MDGRVMVAWITGELKEDQIEKIKTILANPGSFDIPDWFLNRQKVRANCTALHGASARATASPCVPGAPMQWDDDRRASDRDRSDDTRAGAVDKARIRTSRALARALLVRPTDTDADADADALLCCVMAVMVMVCACCYRQDHKDGKNSQVVSNQVDTKLRCVSLSLPTLPRRLSLRSALPTGILRSTERTTAALHRRF
jgi:hypothetical protein